MQTSVKGRLQQVDDYEFEHFMADMWERMGWQCEVSQTFADAGIDVTATKTTPYPQKKTHSGEKIRAEYDRRRAENPAIREFEAPARRCGFSGRRNHEFLHLISRAAC
jgi:hypothetical protein